VSALQDWVKANPVTVSLVGVAFYAVALLVVWVS
jgi:hypothetical protein